MKSDWALQFCQLKKELTVPKSNTDQIKKPLAAVSAKQIEEFYQQFLENDLEIAMEETFKMSQHDVRK